MGSQDLLPFESAWPLVAAAVSPLPVETVPVLAANRRVLRGDARAVWDLPLVDNSAMDGYAVRAEDTASAPACKLRLLDHDAYAGSPAARLEPGTAVAIGTGGVIPEGADAVAVKEITLRHGTTVTVTETVAAGTHVRRAGEELRSGMVVVPAGDRLDPLRITAAAMAGVAEVQVARLPRVAVVSTGNELVRIGEQVQPGQVITTNTPLLALWLADLLGGEPLSFDPVADEPEQLRTVFAQGLAGTDLLLISGGVSVGDRDLVKEVLVQELGVQRLLWRVAQRPGTPTFVGRRGEQWIVALPGNPAAVAAGWHLLVRPLLLALMGARFPQPQRIPVHLAEVVRPNRLRTLLRWCRGAWRDGTLWATPLRRSGSHMLNDFTQADLLVLVPPGTGAVPAGTRLEAIQLSANHL